MIIVKIVGGLGNQMFQYAYAKKLQMAGYDVKLDTTSFETYNLHGGFGLDRYRIDLEIASRKEVDRFIGQDITKRIKSKLSFLVPHLLKERSLLFDPSMLHPKNDRYIEGYFQSEKYFFEIKDVLYENFRLKQQPDDYTRKMQEKIVSCEQSVSIHIRRGDYITDKKAHTIHGTCPKEYYEHAIALFEKEKSGAVFFIFSDDIEWVKKELKIPNAIYVDKPGRIPHEDIYLMSQCKHNIIANSTFSWWGAWLNANDKKIVVAPKRWFAESRMQAQARDVLPERWKRL